MPGIQVLLPVIFAMRGRNDNDGMDVESGARNPHSGVVKRWLSIAISFILQTNKPDRFSPTYRWLPIVSGLLVPFAILLEIPGLTEHWYVRLDKQTHKAVEYRANTPLLTAGLAVSMACAVIANVALLTRFLEKHVKATTIIAMCFLTIHDIINIVAIIAFGLQGRKDDGFTYATAYWLTVCSTIASTITNVTLIWDYIRTDRFASSGSGLTNKQRSLVIVVIILLSWIAVGAGVYTALLNLPFQDSLYFTIVSIETIGFGDIVPHNTRARIFNFFYTIIGILNLALAVSTIRDVIGESFAHARTLRRRRASRRRAHRQRALRLNPFSGDHFQQHHPPPLSPHTLFGRRRISEFDEEIDLSQDLPQQNSPTTTVGDEYLLLPNATNVNDAEYIKELQEGESSDAKSHILLSSTIFIVFWLVGSLIFMKTEGWGYGTSLYFCFVAWTTIGYGEIAPKTPAGRAIFVLWAMIGVGSLTTLISVISEAYAGTYQTVVSNSALEYQIHQKAVALVRSRTDSHAQAHKAGAITADIPASGSSHSRLNAHTLARDLIAHARKYHPHMRHALSLDKASAHPLAAEASGGADEGNAGHPLPKELQDPESELRVLLLEDLEEEDEDMKETILRNAELRKALFALSYDKSFDKLMQIALALTNDNNHTQQDRFDQPTDIRYHGLM